MFRRLLIDSQRLVLPSAIRMPATAVKVPDKPIASSPLPPPLQHHRLQHTDDRSVVKVLNMESDAGLMVDAFSQIGFRLNNGLSVVGPVALFPKTVLSWRVKSVADINEDSLSLFYLLEPKIGDQRNDEKIKDEMEHGKNQLREED
uniref:Uncharacterized protein n=1 Tax=Scylla olivacea TaxID=85551 RepID=A0A0P4W092_SCYOL